MLDLTLQQRILVLGRDETRPARRRPVRVGDLPAGEVGVAEIADLALGHQIIQRAQGFIDRRIGIGLVKLIEVDPVGSQPGQAVFDGAHDPAPGSPLATLIVADPHAELGGQNDIAAALAQRLAEEFLRLCAAIDVGGVEKGDPRVDRGADHRIGRLGVDPHSEIVAAETDLTDFQTGGSKAAKLHGRLSKPGHGIVGAIFRSGIQRDRRNDEIQSLYHLLGGCRPSPASALIAGSPRLLAISQVWNRNLRG